MGFIIVVGAFLVYRIVELQADVSDLESRVNELERKIKRG